MQIFVNAFLNLEFLITKLKKMKQYYIYGIDVLYIPVKKFKNFNNPIKNN